MFLVPTRLPGGVEGLSVLIAVVGNVAAARLGGFGFGTPLAAAMPGLGWLVAVIVLAGGVPGMSAHPPDVLLPGKLPQDPGIGVGGIGYLFAGAVAAPARGLCARPRIPAAPTPSASSLHP